MFFNLNKYYKKQTAVSKPPCEIRSAKSTKIKVTKLKLHLKKMLTIKH